MTGAMPFGTLWLPCVASAVAVFVVSAIAHMVLKHHKADYKGLPDEDAVAEALRKPALGPGVYVLPYCADQKRMKDPDMQARYAKGPVGMITLLPSGMPNMGKLLGLWFGHCLLISFIAAYIARHTLSLDADPMLVWRVTGAVAFAGYAMGEIHALIWRGQPLANTLRDLLDAVVYAVLTGLVFRLLWP
jgi:hypothetical protein